ncbi:unnamed protein product [Dibothriocephalus latus]|uniref:Uncharacterized protein n=1 Tax=Dibothriocephalus latus TaxID=60516 RepID=A0A3P7LC12_DIBLA|nr:unnamed protein product [Dibothriocephalus latus]
MVGSFNVTDYLSIYLIYALPFSLSSLVDVSSLMSDLLSVSQDVSKRLRAMQQTVSQLQSPPRTEAMSLPDSLSYEASSTSSISCLSPEKSHTVDMQVVLQKPTKKPVHLFDELSGIYLRPLTLTRPTSAPERLNAKTCEQQQQLELPSLPRLDLDSQRPRSRHSHLRCEEVAGNLRDINEMQALIVLDTNGNFVSPDGSQFAYLTALDLVRSIFTPDETV